MNSKSLQCDKSVNASIKIPVLATNDLFATIMKLVADLFAGSNIGHSRAWYQMKHKQAAQAEMRLDSLRSLPVEEKHRLGMYNFMD